MRLHHLVARGFRNLADLECEPPSHGVALLGANAQGKTNFLEAVYYPVLFRSLRGAADHEIARLGGPGFHLDASFTGSSVDSAGTSYRTETRRKRIALNGAEADRLTDAVGHWLAVAFVPGDVGLASGPAAVRRQYLDRLLSLADRRYLRALTRYRAALSQRNSALRQGRPELAAAFDGALAEAGSCIVAAREQWVAGVAERYAAEFRCLGETGTATIGYRGADGLASPSAWPEALEAAGAQDRARGMSTVGPHRDELELRIGGRRLRDFGSTGQQRCAAIALKLMEMETLREARGTEPALLLDDVFAELDRDRQRRLAGRLMGPQDRQVFLTAPRYDELPREVELPRWEVRDGKVR